LYLCLLLLLLLQSQPAQLINVFGQEVCGLKGAELLGYLLSILHTPSTANESTAVLLVTGQATQPQQTGMAAGHLTITSSGREAWPTNILRQQAFAPHGSLSS